MITAGEETELLVGVKNDGKSIKYSLLYFSFQFDAFDFVNCYVCHYSVVMPFIFHLTLKHIFIFRYSST